MKFDFKGLGIDLTNIKEFEEAIASYKKVLKADEKTTKDSNRTSAIEIANEAIKDGTLVKGTKIVVIYNHEKVIGELKTNPTAEAKNLAVTSDSFKNKDKFAYIPKYNYIEIAG